MSGLTSIGSSIGALPYFWLRANPCSGKWFVMEGFANESQAFHDCCPDILTSVGTNYCTDRPA
jgi:hypothetical protein